MALKQKFFTSDQLHEYQILLLSIVDLSASILLQIMPILSLLVGLFQPFAYFRVSTSDLDF